MKVEKKIAIEQFREHLEHYRYGGRKKPYSPHTIQSYLRTFVLFAEFLPEDITEITQQEVDDFQESLEIQGRKARGINIRMAGLRRVLAFLSSVYHIPILGHVPVKEIQTQDYLDTFLQADVDRIIAATKKKKDVRAEAIITTLAYTGLRVSELLQLRVSDVEKKKITIIGKGGKARDIFSITTGIRSSWQRYLTQRLDTDKEKEDGHLFTGKRGALQRNAVYRIVKYYVGQAHFIGEEKAHPHNFRHFFGKYLDEQGYTITEIADILGHSDINTSRIYTKRSQDEMRRKLEKSEKERARKIKEAEKQKRKARKRRRKKL